MITSKNLKLIAKYTPENLGFAVVCCYYIYCLAGDPTQKEELASWYRCFKDLVDDAEHISIHGVNEIAKKYEHP